MSVSEVLIRRYRSITQPLQMRCSPQVNIFIGQNNSGKTNILDSIHLLLDPQAQPELAFPETDVEIKLKDGRLLAYGSSVGKKTSSLLKTIRISADEPIDYDFIDKAYGRLYRQYPDRFMALQTVLSETFPSFESSEDIVTVGRDGVRVRQGEETLVLDRMGHGFQKIFYILLAVFHPDYDVVLLDEPESHLHPALIKKLAVIFASKSTNQIFLTTHSPLFVRPQWLNSLYRVDRTPERGTEVFYLNQSRVRLEPRRLLQELNADNLEMFFADKVLLVEGVSDRILMRGLIDRFYSVNKEIKVVETNGKGSMDVFSDVLEAFHIPYSILVDADAWGFWAGSFAARRGWSISRNRAVAARELFQHGVMILPSGTIERYYPQKYQREKKKPLNAMRAASQISRAEYQSAFMEPLRRLILSL